VKRITPTRCRCGSAQHLRGEAKAALRRGGHSQRLEKVEAVVPHAFVSRRHAEPDRSFDELPSAALDEVRNHVVRPNDAKQVRVGCPSKGVVPWEHEAITWCAIGLSRCQSAVSVTLRLLQPYVGGKAVRFQ
jgi:hypothetical protein